MKGSLSTSCWRGEFAVACRSGLAWNDCCCYGGARCGPASGVVAHVRCGGGSMKRQHVVAFFQGSVVLRRGLHHGFDEGCIVFMRGHWLILMQGVW